MKLDLLTADVPEIFPFLETVLQDGGKKNYEVTGDITRIQNLDGLSGFEYKEDGISGHLSVGLILGGTGYAMKRVLHNNGEVFERHDYYNIQGACTFTSDREALKSIIVDFHEIDLTCPILNHLYNFLSLEYKNAGEGRSQTALVHSVELFLKKMYK